MRCPHCNEWLKPDFAKIIDNEGDIEVNLTCPSCGHWYYAIVEMETLVEGE